MATQKTALALRAAGVGLALALTFRGRPMIDLGLATYAEAKRDLDLGVQEEGGHNLGPAIEEYAKPFGIPLPANWCAMAVSAWITRAARLHGLKSPVQGSASAKELMAQFVKASRWVEPAEINDAEDLRRGNVLVWHRGEVGAWTGHVGVISEHEPGTEMIYTIEGNSGSASDRVARMARKRHDPLLLGVGLLRPTTPTS